MDDSDNEGNEGQEGNDAGGEWDEYGDGDRGNHNCDVDYDDVKNADDNYAYMILTIILPLIIWSKHKFHYINLKKGRKRVK